MKDYNAIVVSRQFDHETGRERIHIDQADPQAHISADLLMQATEGECGPFLTVSGEQLDVITVADDYGQKFIYRLGNYVAVYDAFEIEWPD